MGVEIDDHTRLLERELIDSMGILELVAYLEETLKTPVDQSIITAKTFASARSIADALEASARSE